MTALALLLAALPVSSGFGLWQAHGNGVRHPDGSAQSAQPAPPRTPRQSDEPAAAAPTLLDAAVLGRPLGARATLVQFSSAFCQPCRLTRAVLADVANTQDGVEHVELDAESHLGLVRRLGVLRTPTVLFLDANGREVGRATGAPRKQQVLDALGALAPHSQP